MVSPASVLRSQIEAALARRIPSALTPAPKMIHPVAATGIHAVDELLSGGIPLGAIAEIVGPECSGRTSLALSFVARLTQMAKLCAWVDVSDALHPESAAAVGVNLSHLLWIRCGVKLTRNLASSCTKFFQLPEKCFAPPPVKKGLHGGGPHPREEVKGLSAAVGGLFRPEAPAPRCAEPQPRVRKEKAFATLESPKSSKFSETRVSSEDRGEKPWARIDQALRVTDLLLQAGGFAAIVLDMGGIAPEYVSRVPLATWFRYRAAAERSQVSILLLSQHDCAKSSAGLVLRLETGEPTVGLTVFGGVEYRVEVTRNRSKQDLPEIYRLRNPPQRATSVHWRSRASWTGER